MRHFFLALCLFLFIFTIDAQAQGQQRRFRGGPGEAPIMMALPMESAPTLDGRVTSDPAWDFVPVATGFTQTAPEDGEPATERTEVRIGFTNEMLYVGVVLFDSDPSGLITADTRRDADMGNSDSFRFILDTFSDGQNGFVFGTNAAGAEYDAQLAGSSGGSGFGGRMRGGSGGGLNVNWDSSWEVVASVSDYGWSAEFAIPFTTIRYPKGENQTWGVNFERTIRRNNETAFWAPLERQFNLTRLTHAGQLQGMNVPDSRNLKILPYALASANHDYTAAQAETEYDGDLGVDVKYSITPSLTLDATYNTDFAQVEVDEQQINLDRFSLFFPEKRPFFLENAGLFSVGETGEAEVFFSRRIGIDEGGGTVPILGGARITGSVGAYKVGLLEMQTEEVGGVIQANNFGVARVMREFPNRTSVGVLFTNRLGTGDLAPEDDYNRVGAFDAKVGIGDYGSVSGFIAASDTPGREGNATAGQLSGTYSNERVTLSAGYTEVAEAFNPEVGFLRRSDYRKLSGSVFTRFRPEDFIGIQELRPHVNYRGYWQRDGFQQTGYLHVDNHWEFRSGYEIHTGRNWTYEGVDEAFDISEGVRVPVGDYSHAEWAFRFMTPEKDAVRFELAINRGGFFGGDRTAIVPTLSARKGDKLTTEIALGHNRVELPGGEFRTNLFRARASYSFTPRIYLQALGQYNDQTEEWSMRFVLVGFRRPIQDYSSCTILLTVLRVWTRTVRTSREKPFTKD
ncbi:MAG: DUF5916 domain-containing protein [Rhodothermales bacterium]|nr:DUF5916 domain-containing protein [Rhodothermales bacterium]